ncbi:MAG: hypothetical protein IT531_22945 [Burkholderiales bacterium]|nr:hypothetical protein [Burkholderiales bacterium]
MPAIWLLAIVLCSAAGAAVGRTLHATPESYRALLAQLKPGDTLLLEPGEYRDGLPVHYLLGSPAAPIVIRGPAQDRPALFIARSRANTVSIIDSAHVHIRDLTLDGRSIAVDAVKAEGHARFAHHITLENLTIVGHDASQQNVGISTKCPAWGWVIRSNRIHRAGTGMYLGNSGGIGPFYGGLIEHNLVTDPIGYAIQIKHQHARPALELAPRGRHVTVIRHNVLSKANGGSAGPDARPNLLLGHWPLAGEGSSDEYLVYGNFFHENPHEALIQAEGNVAFYSNVLQNRHGPGVHVQPHNDVPRQVRIVANTIITSGSPIVVRTNEATVPTQQVVHGNAVFSPHPAAGGVQSGNLHFAFDEASKLLASAPGELALDPYPTSDALRCAALDPGLVHGMQEASCDFNGRSRAMNYCGAYAGHGRNPGWLPALALKPSTACRSR